MAEVDLNALLLIGLVALGTYSLRLSGLLVSNKFVKDEGRIKIFLDYLPSTILLSLVVPSILKEGFIGVFATACIILCMYKTKNILLSMVIAVLIVAFSRDYIMA